MNNVGNSSLVVGQSILDGAMIRNNEDQRREEGCNLGGALAGISCTLMSLAHVFFVWDQVRAISIGAIMPTHSCCVQRSPQRILPSTGPSQCTPAAPLLTRCGCVCYAVPAHAAHRRGEADRRHGSKQASNGRRSHVVEVYL